jgi:hypothetical protein
MLLNYVNIGIIYFPIVHSRGIVTRNRVWSLNCYAQRGSALWQGLRLYQHTADLSCGNSVPKQRQGKSRRWVYSVMDSLLCICQ